MLKERDAVIRRAVIALDASLVFIVFWTTFFLRRSFHIFYKLDLIPSARVVSEMMAPPQQYFLVIILAIPIWCFALYMNGMYRSLRTKNLLEITWIIIKSSAMTTLIFGTIVFLFKLDFISRAFFIIFMTLSSVLIFAEKVSIFYVMHFVRKRGYNYRRILIVGTGRRAMQFLYKLEHHPEWGFRIAGLVDYENTHVGKILSGVEVLAELEDIPKILRRRSIDEVIFIVPRAQLSRIENYLYVCETQGVPATVAVDLFDLKISRLRQTELDGIPFITFETTSTKEWQLFLKRVIDIVASGAAMLILSPLFIVVALAIRLTSKGPVFYIQKRVGLNGRKFVLYKFRSMYEGAHQKLSELSGLNEMKGPVFKIKNDPRITPVGRFLRKFSIDEFPQLFNVFAGHMSLVGPRPPIPKEVMQYEPWQRRRLSMRPGITCVWQVSGRNKIDFEGWMKLDLEYIDNWSLWLDIKILCKTIPAVLSGRGAY